MQTLSQRELLGYVELEVGSKSVQVPIRAADASTEGPVASFTVDGETYAILLRQNVSDAKVKRAVAAAARQAMRHLSHKLLN